MKGIEKKIVKKGLKKIKCMIKRRKVVEGDKRRIEELKNEGREEMMVGELKNKEGLNRNNIMLRKNIEKLIEIGRCEKCCSDKLEKEKGRI